ncbi:hypothetical protein Tco_0705791 [Tanacetum coccineum]|uniref:Retrotransposon gag domain-containing protein n=1 Tax=Tanacetum coccineum TaxID=301880 RepID=A0ABQ4Y6G3_9ASTR
MAEIKTETIMDKFVDDDRANYYSGITRIMVNGKNSYELKGKFLDDLLNNAFSRTNGEDAVEHIDYFLKIVDPIKLPNMNYERIRLAIFPTSLVGNTSEWFDEIKGSITSWVDLTEFFFGKDYPPSHTSRIMATEAIRDPRNSTFEKWLASKFANHMIMDTFIKKVLRDFWIKSNDHKGVVDEEFFDAEKANNDDEQDTAEIFRIETNLFNYETPTKTYEDYENELNDELEEPWPEDGVPYEICDHICEPFRFKNGKAKWPTCNSNEDGFCNGGELPGMVRVGITYKDHTQTTTVILLDKEEHKDKDKHGLFNDHDVSVCKIKRFEMFKYSFSEDEDYVPIKEHEYDDLTSTNEDACRTYQEIFRRMDEAWMVIRAK